MNIILELLLDAAVLLLLARVMPTIQVRNYGTAIAVALVVGILNATIGAIIRFPLNLITFWLLSFFVRLLVTAIMIKIADRFFSGFEVKTFSAAVIVACVMAIAATLFSYVL